MIISVKRNFLELKKNHGIDSEKARDLFYGLWISDLFMQRVKDNQPWSVICPTQCPGLQDAIGENYKQLYEQCESSGNVVKLSDDVLSPQSLLCLGGVFFRSFDFSARENLTSFFVWNG